MESKKMLPYTWVLQREIINYVEQSHATDNIDHSLQPLTGKAKIKALKNMVQLVNERVDANGISYEYPFLTE